MPPAGFEPTVPASERMQTHTLARAATGIGSWNYLGTRIMTDMFTRVWKAAVVALRKAHFGHLPNKAYKTT